MLATQGSHINQSLLALGRVIQALAETKVSPFVWSFGLCDKEVGMSRV